MKLLRATCDCGFQTRKARVGYHFHQWWFPLLNTRTGELTDVLRSLPGEQVDRIQLGKVPADELHCPYLESVTRELLTQFADQSDAVFNPDIDSTCLCPTCGHNSLRVQQVYVTAICTSDCRHEYQWLDSEQRGCPRCGTRPHRFQVDLESRFSDQARTTSSCRCRSGLDSASHLDAYCPKCGKLPTRYVTGGRAYCGAHHTPLQPYRCPGNYLFIESSSRRAADQFPNAKLWGDAESADHEPSSYCPTCESEHRRWLAAESAD